MLNPHVHISPQPPLQIPHNSVSISVIRSPNLSLIPVFITLTILKENSHMSHDITTFHSSYILSFLYPSIANTTNTSNITHTLPSSPPLYSSHFIRPSINKTPKGNHHMNGRNNDTAQLTPLAPVPLNTLVMFDCVLFMSLIIGRLFDY